MKKFKLLAAAAVLSTGVAHADPVIISNWDYINEAGWTNYEPSSAITASGNSANGGTSILSTGALPDQLCWGTPFGGGTQQSCLEAGSPVSGNVQTVGVGQDYTSSFANGTTITHDNFKLVAGDNNSLESVMLVDGLQLTGMYNGSTEVVSAPELAFSILFTETFNSGGNNCCDDIFEVNEDFGGMLLAQGEDYIDFAVNFTVDAGEGVWSNYELITRLSGLQTLGDGRFGFTTEENQSNVLNAEFAIRAVSVPEPSTVGIFALSLLGLGAAARRKKS